MPKKNNAKVTATPHARRLAADLTAAREHIREWKRYEDDTKAALIAEAGGVDVTLYTESGAEVMAITETDPSSSIDWKRYYTDHPEIHDKIDREYRKPATTQVRVTGEWYETSANLPAAPSSTTIPD